MSLGECDDDRLRMLHIIINDMTGTYSALGYLGKVSATSHNCSFMMDVSGWEDKWRV